MYLHPSILATRVTMTGDLITLLYISHLYDNDWRYTQHQSINPCKMSGDLFKSLYLTPCNTVWEFFTTLYLSHPCDTN